MNRYDVIVVGGGHAGIEAALAAVRLGTKVLFVTSNLETLGQMSCNPAVGGQGKSQLVREIDALGGAMGRLTDAVGIQFRMLNTRKGPAVHALRAQADRVAYRKEARRYLEKISGLTLKEAMVEDLVIAGGRIEGVITHLGEEISAPAVVLAPGTFLNGLIHVGLTSYPSGRVGEFPSIGLSRALEQAGLVLKRFKTGTPARLEGKTIDFSALDRQDGDHPPVPFSLTTDHLGDDQVPCHVTYTNPATHRIILENLDRSPLYGGVIKGIGPRYCPSIEDKAVRFRDRDRHQVFLEPEGRETTEIYPNGLSTSLPVDVQVRFYRSIKGLEEVEILRPAYAIEYDVVVPTQLEATLETKAVRGLFLAGQINGTSGYEEAAAQGLLAGANAGLNIQGRPMMTIGREQGYLGVMIDDLISKGMTEPYRMFTSRAEYRLLLRWDNAHQRLTPLGREMGLVGDDVWERFQDREENLNKAKVAVAGSKAGPDPEVNQALTKVGSSPLSSSVTLETLLKRPEVDWETLTVLSPELGEFPPDIGRKVEVEVKYEGYLRRQEAQVERMKRLEGMIIPDEFDYQSVKGLSREVVQRLEEIRPRTLGQASRIPGVTPAAVTVLMIILTARRRAVG